MEYHVVYKYLKNDADKIAGTMSQGIGVRPAFLAS